jgi:aminopeptidase N
MKPLFNYFHHGLGEGYKLVSDLVVKLDAINPQVAARCVAMLSGWKKFTPVRAALIREQLLHVKENRTSNDVYEIVIKSLM